MGLQLVGLAHHPQGLVVAPGGLEFARLFLETFDALAALRGWLGVGFGDGGDHPRHGGRQKCRESQAGSFHGYRVLLGFYFGPAASVVNPVDGLPGRTIAPSCAGCCV